MPEKTHKLAAIVFTDIVGYTKRMEENEQKTMQLLQKQREIIFPLVKEYGGKVIKEIGDGLMMMFSSAVQAVRFAIDVQTILKDEELTIRAGIHIGDVIFEKGDVFGSAVNTAARIEPLAQANGICISEDVRNQLQNKTDIQTISLGIMDLKGVKEPVEIFEVFIEGISDWQKKNIAWFFKDLWSRMVLQILAGYLVSSWIIKLAVAAIVARYMLSPHLVDLAWVILLSLLPTVFLLTYFHGKRKT
ncbi:MAG: adenylate/guanylate cyclase domain-containing protein, partial [Bacteroidales bacterium]|nr:adenylate/guanylate cyclase domain-containing protein [Bacteroidales bacterium]